MAEEIKKDIFSRNRRPNMTIGNIEDAWPSIPINPTEQWSAMLADTTMDIPLWKTIPELQYWKNAYVRYTAIPDDGDIPVQHPIQPERDTIRERIKEVLPLIQRINGPEAALFVAAAQDFLEWVKNL